MSWKLAKSPGEGSRRSRYRTCTGWLRSFERAFPPSIERSGGAEEGGALSEYGSHLCRTFERTLTTSTFCSIEVTGDTPGWILVARRKYICKYGLRTKRKICSLLFLFRSERVEANSNSRIFCVGSDWDLLRSRLKAEKDRLEISNGNFSMT